MKINKPIFLILIAVFIHSTIPAVNCSNMPIFHENEHVYIVHVQKPQDIKFLHFSERVNWYKSFLPNSTLDSGIPRMVYAYRHVISGFAAWLTSEEVKAMENLEGFLLARPEVEERSFTTYSPRFLGLDLWDGLWPEAALGQGQVIGVVDGGITPTHPSFRDNVGLPTPPRAWTGTCYWGSPICDNKLIGAVGFIHGRYVAPIDRYGHGTHCAGIAAGSFVEDASVLGQAKGTASGIAPYAHLAAYKVLDLEGKKDIGTSSDVLKGIDEAIRDHVSILSMSVGVKNTIPKSSVSIASFAAVSKGIVPVAAAGNYGPSPSILINDAAWVLTVGASNMDRRIRVTVRLGNGKEYYGESAYQPPFTTQQLPLVYPGAYATREMSACARGSLDFFDVRGKIVLCDQGLNKNAEKGEAVKAAGGAGLIIMNQNEWGNTTSADPHVLPAANIGHNDAMDLVNNYYTVAGNPTAALIFNGAQTNLRPAPTLASFSSRGPSLQNGHIIKPDIIAPGVNILSAWPFEVGPNPTGTKKTFDFNSGTSVATPHVAGIVALLKNNHPNWSPAVIKSALMTTAYIVDLDGNPIQDDYPYKRKASVFDIGAGHVNPVAANDPGLVYDIKLHDYIAHLCGSGFTDSEVSAIVRGLVQCARISKIDADQLNYPSIALYLGSNPERIIRRTLTNVGDVGSTYNVKFDEPFGVSMEVYPPTLQFDKEGQELSYEVKFSLKSGFAPIAGQYSEGQLAWDSGKNFVRSPIAVTFM